MPDDDDVVLEQIRHMLETALDVPHIDAKIPLVDYGLDSMRATEFIIELEDRYSITISDQEAAGLLTLRAIADFVLDFSP